MRLIDADAIPIMRISNFSVLFRKVIDKMPTVDLWHYPSKGEYPPRNNKYNDLNYSVNVLAFTDEDVFEPSVVAYYIPEKGLWIDCVHEEPLEAKVLAWQYIVPPKEEVHE